MISCVIFYFAFYSTRLLVIFRFKYNFRLGAREKTSNQYRIGKQTIGTKTISGIVFAKTADKTVAFTIILSLASPFYLLLL